MVSKKRMLQEFTIANFCSGAVSIEETGLESCDCSQLVGGVGPVSCVIVSNLYEHPCYTISVTKDIQVSFADVSAYMSVAHSPFVTCFGALQINVDGSESPPTYCYNFLQPFVRSFCYYYSYSDNDCVFSVDGVTCNSCSQQYCTSTQSDVPVWDCSNTLGMATGNRCNDDFLIPLFNGNFPYLTSCPPVEYPTAQTSPTTPPLSPTTTPPVEPPTTPMVPSITDPPYSVSSSDSRTNNRACQPWNDSNHAFRNLCSRDLPTLE